MYTNKLSFSADNGLALVQKLLEVLDEKDVLLVFSTARFIQLQRNSFVFEGIFSPPRIVVQQVQTSVELFAKAHSGAWLAG